METIFKKKINKRVFDDLNLNFRKVPRLCRKLPKCPVTSSKERLWATDCQTKRHLGFFSTESLDLSEIAGPEVVGNMQKYNLHPGYCFGPQSGSHDIVVRG